MKTNKTTSKECDIFLLKISKKRLSQKKGLEHIEGYYSKIDESYICSDPKGVEFLLNRGITEDIQNSRNEKEHTSNIGFNPTEQKWYGWSHRAIFGFGIGSEVKKGNFGFKPRNEEEFLENSINFWASEYTLDISGIIATNEQGQKVAQITWVYSNMVPNEKLRGKIGEITLYPPPEWGRGEWTAETLEDAKQMAKDFAEAVS